MRTSTTPCSSASRADRQLEGGEARPEAIAELGEHGVEVGPLPVELVHEHQAGHAHARRPAPTPTRSGPRRLRRRRRPATARSATDRAACRAPAQSASPGVSSRLILWSRHSNGASDSDSDMPRSRSSGSWSQVVVPSSTRPRRGIAPAVCNKASAKRGLAGSVVPDQGDVADPIGSIPVHRLPPPPRVAGFGGW